MTPEETIKQLAADITKSVSDKMGELSQWRAKHDESLAAFGKATDEQKNAIASISKEIEGLNARLTDLMQKSARPEGNVPAARSLGQQVIESDRFKAFQAGGFRGRTGNIPVLLGALTTDNGGGVLVEPQRLPGIRMPGQLPLRVRDLLAVGTTSSNAIEFVREKTFTNNAAAVAENTKKPESVIEFEQDSTTVKTLAHWIPASRQILDDVSQLQSYIDARMLYGLNLVEDNQLMNGDGTGANLKGLMRYATKFDEQLATSSTNKLDRIADAILQVWLTGFPAERDLHASQGHQRSAQAERYDWALSVFESGIGNSPDAVGYARRRNDCHPGRNGACRCLCAGRTGIRPANRDNRYRRPGSG